MSPLSEATTRRWVLVAGFVFQLINIPYLWNHMSADPVYVGRYSLTYAAALAAHCVLLIVWGMTLPFGQRLSKFIAGFARHWRFAMLVLLWLGLFGLWWLPIDIKLRHYVTGTALLVSVWWITTFDDAEAMQLPAWISVLVWLVPLVMVLPIMLHMLSHRAFSPDEALWADLSSNIVVTGHLVRRLVVDEHMAIYPGVGWINALTGYLLAWQFDIRMMRAFHAVFFLMSMIGVWAVANRYFGRQVAHLSTMFALLAGSIFRSVDYRPDHFLAVAAMLMFYSVSKGFDDDDNLVWHGLAGLAVTLSLQLHAAGIVFAFGCSLFYAGFFVKQWAKPTMERSRSLRVVVVYGVGASLGTLAYYVFNILPIGGLDAYLAILATERYSTQREFDFIFMWVPIQYLLIWGGIAVMLWRGNQASRRYVLLLLCVSIGIVLLDSQGYTNPYQAMFLIPVGVLVVTLFKARPTQFTLVSLSLLIFATGWAANIIDWRYTSFLFQQGRLPSHTVTIIADQAEPIIAAERGTIAGHQEIIWLTGTRPNVYSTFADVNRQKPDDLPDGIDFWRRVAPDMFIDMEGRLPLTPAMYDYIDENDFVVCHAIPISNLRIVFYKRDCDEHS